LEVKCLMFRSRSLVMMMMMIIGMTRTMKMKKAMGKKPLAL